MEIVFHNALEELRALADLDNDGHAELIVRNDPELHDVTATGNIGTYSPYIVYNLANFAIDQMLTEKYNKEHYIWEGIKYNDKLQVLYPKNSSRPKLIKTK